MNLPIYQPVFAQKERVKGCVISINPNFGLLPKMAGISFAGWDFDFFHQTAIPSPNSDSDNPAAIVVIQDPEHCDTLE